VSFAGVFGDAGSARKRTYGLAPEALDDICLQALGAMYAPNTLATYRSHVNGYVGFAEARGFPPVPVTLPKVLLYETAYTGDLHRSANTLRVIESSLKMAARFGVWGLDGPAPRYQLTKDDEALLARYQEGLMKVFVPASNQKAPVRFAWLLAAWARRGGRTWADRRDRCWQGLSHNALLRSRETLDLLWSDIRVLRNAGGEIEALQLQLRDSKTADRHENGGVQQVVVARRPAVEEDVVLPLLRFGQECGALGADFSLHPASADRRLFSRSPDGSGVLTREDLASILRADLEGIGLPSSVLNRFSSHSLRSGGATDMRDSGISLAHIIAQGRWRSSAWKVYFRTTQSVVPHLLGLKALPAPFPDSASPASTTRTQPLSPSIGLPPRPLPFPRSFSPSDGGPVPVHPFTAVDDLQALLRGHGELASSSEADCGSLVGAGAGGGGGSSSGGRTGVTGIANLPIQSTASLAATSVGDPAIWEPDESARQRLEAFVAARDVAGSPSPSVLRELVAGRRGRGPAPRAVAVSEDVPAESRDRAVFPLELGTQVFVPGFAGPLPLVGYSMVAGTPYYQVEWVPGWVQDHVTTEVRALPPDALSAGRFTRSKMR
jgi:hypothetical protein